MDISRPLSRSPARKSGNEWGRMSAKRRAAKGRNILQGGGSLESKGGRTNRTEETGKRAGDKSDRARGRAESTFRAQLSLRL